MRISISIVIPIYNVEKYVQRCLESVIDQDSVNADIECIIVDDCTPDDSMNIVYTIVSGYQGPIRFKLLTHDNNRGLSAARNTGLLNSTGNYIFFIDSDDYIMPNSLKYFIEYQKMYPYVDIIIGNVKKSKGGDLLIPNIQDPLLLEDCNVFITRMFHHQIYLYAWNKLIRRDLLMDNNIRFEEGILFEDQCWSYELFSHLSSLLLFPQVTYIYENNPFSIVNTVFSKEKADLVLISYTISVNKMLDNPPDFGRFHCNIVVDYFLFMIYFLMNGVDLLTRCSVSDSTAADFRGVRLRLISKILRNGRLFLFFFFLLLFPPLCYVQRIRYFRKNYYYIETIVNRISHLTDFLHNKNRL